MFDDLPALVEFVPEASNNWRPVDVAMIGMMVRFRGPTHHDQVVGGDGGVARRGLGA